MTLVVSPELSLPIEAVTETFGILAKKGAGKSNAAVVMAEEMFAAGVPWVAIDPKGDWWGVRSSADGTSPGLPLPVFGGLHGDVPLEPTAGHLLADLVAEERLTCVLDVSEFTKGDVRRFLLAFAERLIRRNTEPLHLFLEEAHEYLPQRVMRDEAQLVGAWSKIVKQGRFRGLGATLVSQRSASLNKDVLTQVDTLIAMRTTAPQDRKAILAWVEEHDFGHELVASLPGLEDGEAWVWSPEFLRTTERIRFRRRQTFDSGATPKMGVARRAPATLADVDLAAIKEQMAETIEKAKAEDPKELRRRIAALEREIAEVRTATPEPIVERVEVEVPVLPGEVVADLRSTLDAFSAGLEDIRGRLAAWDDRKDVPRTGPAGGGAGAVGAGRDPQRADPPQRREPRRAPVPRPEATPVDVALTPSDRKVLGALAQYPDGRSRRQLALLTGYKESGGRFGNLLSALRSRGLVVGGRENLAITATGLEVLGEWEPLPTGPQLGRYWLDKLPPSEAKVLGALLEVWPEAMAKAELAAAAGYEPSGGRFGNICSRLRTLGLIEGSGELRAVDELAS
jgi:hypothetical protein